MKNIGLLEEDFKIKFGLRLCLLVITGMLAVTLFVYFVTSKSLGESYVKAIYTIYDLKIRIFPLIFASFYSIFILGVVTAAIAGISILFSHKIAGPIFRIEKNLELIGKGDLTVNTRFRGADQLSSLASEINAMVRALNHSARSCGDAIEEIKGCEERIILLLKEENPDEGELKRAAEALETAIDKLRKATSGIKVK